MARTSAVIDININTSQASANLRKLQTQINAFNSTLRAGNEAQSIAARNLANDLSSLVNSSSYFTAETLRMQTAASRLDSTLSKGRGTIAQYFSARFNRDGAAAAEVLSLANARAAALQTQFIATSAAANGFREAIAVRPMTAFNSEAAVSAERLSIHRAMLNQATTSMINFGKNTQWAGRQLMVGFTVPLGIFAATASRTFAEIEKEAISFKKVYGDSFTTPGEVEENYRAVQGLAKEYTKYGIAVSDTIALAAQAAAAGAQNTALMDATTEATRLATLGQMEQNKALEATIALQNAFGLSGEKLSKSINFLNMVENQTVVTLQDLADAIPRVAPVIVGLGGTVEDMAAFLAAMQEGGVSAAQGANALKSGLGSLINPTEKATRVLGDLGVNINAIVQSNRGDLMGTVKGFAQALESLDEFSRQQALEELFGKFQYARLGALFNNIIKDGTQAARVLDLATLSTEQLAKSAEKELGVIEASPLTKFTGAMERLKASIAPVGEMFMKIAAPVLEFFAMLFEKINALPDIAKKFLVIGTIVTGVLIPAGTMFLGLLMNLLGTLVKFGSLTGLAFKGLVSGGFRGALKNVADALKYTSLAEMDTATAASQLAESTTIANSALRSQVGAADNARRAVDQLSQAYGILINRMEQTVALSATTSAGRSVNFGAGQEAINQARQTTRPRVRRNAGGPIYLNDGNTVPGVGNTDTVPAMLTPGEFVVNKEATKQNLGLLYAINNGQNIPGFNRGGAINYGTTTSMRAGLPLRILGRRQRVLVDIDGTVVNSPGGNLFSLRAEDFSPIPKNIERIKRLREQGIDVEFVTARTPELADMTYETLRRLGLDDIPVTFNDIMQPGKRDPSKMVRMSAPEYKLAIAKKRMEQGYDVSLLDDDEKNRRYMEENGIYSFFNKGGMIPGVQYFAKNIKQREVLKLKNKFVAAHASTSREISEADVLRPAERALYLSEDFTSGRLKGQAHTLDSIKLVIDDVFNQFMKEGASGITNFAQFATHIRSIPISKLFQHLNLPKGTGGEFRAKIANKIQEYSGTIIKDAEFATIFDEAVEEMLEQLKGDKKQELFKRAIENARREQFTRLRFEIPKDSPGYASVAQAKKAAEDAKQIEDIKNGKPFYFVNTSNRKSSALVWNENTQRIVGVTTDSTRKIAMANTGGLIQYYSDGGSPTVPGVGNTDTVPAMLTPGEFVVNKESTAQNLSLLHAINDGNISQNVIGLNKGGFIPGVQYFGINNPRRVVEFDENDLLSRLAATHQDVAAMGGPRRRSSSVMFPATSTSVEGISEFGKGILARSSKSRVIKFISEKLGITPTFIDRDTVGFHSRYNQRMKPGQSNPPTADDLLNEIYSNEFDSFNVLRAQADAWNTRNPHNRVDANIIIAKFIKKLEDMKGQRVNDDIIKPLYRSSFDESGYSSFLEQLSRPYVTSGTTPLGAIKPALERAGYINRTPVAPPGTVSMKTAKVGNDIEITYLDDEKRVISTQKIIGLGQREYITGGNAKKEDIYVIDDDGELINLRSAYGEIGYDQSNPYGYKTLKTRGLAQGIEFAHANKGGLIGGIQHLVSGGAIQRLMRGLNPGQLERYLKQNNQWDDLTEEQLELVRRFDGQSEPTRQASRIPNIDDLFKSGASFEDIEKIFSLRPQRTKSLAGMASREQIEKWLRPDMKITDLQTMYSNNPMDDETRRWFLTQILARRFAEAGFNKGGMIPGVQYFATNMAQRIAQPMSELQKIGKIKEAYEYVFPGMEERSLRSIYDLEFGDNAVRGASPAQFISGMFERWERVPQRPSPKEDTRLLRRTGKFKYPQIQQEEYLADMIMSDERFKDYAPDVFKPITIGELLVSGGEMKTRVFDGHTRIHAMTVSGLIRTMLGRDPSKMSKEEIIASIREIKEMSESGQLTDAQVLAATEGRSILTSRAHKHEIEAMYGHPRSRKQMPSMFNSSGRVLIPGVHDREINEILNAARSARFYGVGDDDKSLMESMGFVERPITGEYYYDPSLRYRERSGYVNRTGRRIIESLIDEGKILPLRRNNGGMIPGVQYFATKFPTRVAQPGEDVIRNIVERLQTRGFMSLTREEQSILESIATPYVGTLYKGASRASSVVPGNLKRAIESETLAPGEMYPLVRGSHSTDSSYATTFATYETREAKELAKIEDIIISSLPVGSDRRNYKNKTDDEILTIVKNEEESKIKHLEDLLNLFRTTGSSQQRISEREKELNFLLQNSSVDAVTKALKRRKELLADGYGDRIVFSTETGVADVPEGMMRIVSAERGKDGILRIHAQAGSVSSVDVSGIAPDTRYGAADYVMRESERFIPIQTARKGKLISSIPKFKNGGEIFGSMLGINGPTYDSPTSSTPIVPGVGNTDTVPAMLTPGEFVINKDATAQNLDILHAINNGGIIGANGGAFIPKVIGEGVKRGSMAEILKRFPYVAKFRQLFPYQQQTLSFAEAMARGDLSPIEREAAGRRRYITRLISSYTHKPGAIDERAVSDSLRFFLSQSPEVSSFIPDRSAMRYQGTLYRGARISEGILPEELQQAILGSRFYSGPTGISPQLQSLIDSGQIFAVEPRSWTKNPRITDQYGDYVITYKDTSQEGHLGLDVNALMSHPTFPGEQEFIPIGADGRKIILRIVGAEKIGPKGKEKINIIVERATDISENQRRRAISELESRVIGTEDWRMEERDSVLGYKSRKSRKLARQEIMALTGELARIRDQILSMIDAASKGHNFASSFAEARKIAHLFNEQDQRGLYLGRAMFPNFDEIAYHIRLGIWPYKPNEVRMIGANEGGFISRIQKFLNGGEVFGQMLGIGGPTYDSPTSSTPIVPGVGNTDTVPAMLTPGEFVINKQATSANLPLLHAINNGGIIGANKGGMIPGVQYLIGGGPAINATLRRLQKIKQKTNNPVQTSMIEDTEGYQRDLFKLNNFDEEIVFIPSIGSVPTFQSNRTISTVRANPQSLILKALEANPNDPKLQSMLANIRNKQYGEDEIELLDNITASLMINSEKRDGLGIVLSALSGNETARAELKTRRTEYYKLLKKRKEEKDAMLAESMRHFVTDEKLEFKDIAIIHATKHKLPVSVNGDVELQPSGFHNLDDPARVPRSSIHFTLDGAVQPGSGALLGSGNFQPHKQIVVSSLQRAIDDNGLPASMAPFDTWYTTSPGKPVTMRGASIVTPFTDEAEYRNILLKKGIIKEGDLTPPLVDDVGQLGVLYLHIDEQSQINAVQRAKAQQGIHSAPQKIQPTSTDDAAWVRQVSDLARRHNIGIGLHYHDESFAIERLGTFETDVPDSVGRTLTTEPGHAIPDTPTALDQRTVATVTPEEYLSLQNNFLQQRSGQSQDFEGSDPNPHRYKVAAGQIYPSAYKPMVVTAGLINKGGLIPAFYANNGNIVPGVGNTDTVPAMLTPGEFVVNKDATQQNLALLHAINGGFIRGYAGGGEVTGPTSLNAEKLYTDSEPLPGPGSKTPGALDRNDKSLYIVTDKQGQKFYFHDRESAQNYADRIYRPARTAARGIRERARERRDAARNGRLPSVRQQGRGANENDDDSKKPRMPKMSGQARMGASMGAGALGGALMMAPMIPGVAENQSLSNAMTMGGLGLSAISMLAMLPAPLMAIAAVAATAGISLYKLRDSLDTIAKESAKAGANMGGAANRMEEVSAATGYQFASGRMGDSLFRFSNKEIQNASQFSQYFESERGQKFIDDLNKLTMADRYKKVASIIAQAVADGMDPKTAKAYGNAIAYYTGDALLRSKIYRDFKEGNFEKGTQVLIDLIKERKAELDKLPKLDQSENIGLSSGTENLRGMVGRNSTLGTAGTAIVAEGLAKTGAGAGAGAATGATIGFVLGSVVPIIGNAVGAGVGAAIGAVAGTIVGGIIAYKQAQEQIKKLNENVKQAAMTFGSSIQVMKEVKNAEAAITEARIKGKITQQQYIDQMNQLREIENDTSEVMKNLIENTLSNPNLDSDAIKQAMKDQFVISGFDADLAEAITNMVNLEEVARSLFPNENIEDVLNDPAKKEVAMSVLTETLAGITPENAQQKLSEVKGIWAQIAQDLLDAARDGLTNPSGKTNLTPEQTKDIQQQAAAKRAAKDVLYSASGKTELTEEEVRAAATRAIAGGSKVEGGKRNLTRYYVDKETGLRFEQKPSKDLMDILSESKVKDVSGSSSVYSLKANLVEDTDLTPEDIGKMREILSSESARKDKLTMADLLEKMFMENKDFLTDSYTWTDEMYKNLGLSKEIIDQIRIDVQGLEGPEPLETLPSNVSVVKTEIDKAAESFATLISDEERLANLQVSADQLMNAYTRLTDYNLARSIAEGGAEFDRFAGMVKELSKFPGIDIQIMMQTEEGKPPEEVAKTIEKTLKQIDKLKLKGIKKEIKEALPDPQEFISLSRKAGKEWGDIASNYNKVATQTQMLAKKFDKENTGAIKSEDLTVGVIYEIFGEDVEDHNALLKAIQNAFPETLDTMLLPIMAQIQNPQVIAMLGQGGPNAEAIFKAYAEGKTTARVSANTPYGTSYYDMPIENFDTDVTPGTTPKSGGGGAKSLSQQLSEQLKIANKMFKALSKTVDARGFKSFIAGPFAPEFLQYLSQQGEEGIKILRGGIDKIKKEYEKFKNIKITESASNALVSIFLRSRQLGNQFMQMNFGRALMGQGLSNERLDYVSQAISEDDITSLMALRSKRNKTDIEKRKQKALEQNLMAAIEQSKAAASTSQLLEIQSGINESKTALETFSILTRKGVDPLMAQQLMDLGMSAESAGAMSKDGLAALSESVRNINIAEKLKEVNASLKEMADGVTFEKLLNGIAGIAGSSPEMIDEIRQLGIPFETLRDKPELVRSIAIELNLLKAAAEAAKDPLQRLSETIDLQISAAQAQMEKYNITKIRPLEKELDLINESIRRKERDIELESRKKEPFEKNIQALEKQKTVLDEVANANDRISRQQRSQLDIAAALSRGDIAGAAQATLAAQQEQASQRIEDTRTVIDEEIKQNRLEIEAVDERIKTMQLELRDIQDAAYNKQLEIETAKKEQLKTEEKIYKMQLLQNIVQARAAVLNAARTGNEQKIIAAQQALNAMVLTAGETPEQRNQFFNGIPGAGQVLTEAQATTQASPAFLAAQAFGQLKTMLTEIQGNSKSIIDKLMVARDITEEEAKTLFAELTKEGNPAQKIIDALSQAGISLFDMLVIDGKAADGNVPGLLNEIGNSVIATAEQIAKMPPLAEAMYNAFESMKSTLDGKIADARGVVSAINAAIATWNSRSNTTASVGGGIGGRPAPFEGQPKYFGGMINYKGSRERPPGMMYGGRMKRYAAGAFVPGMGNSDKVPALLTPGEFVVRKSVAEVYGPMLKELNSQIYPSFNSDVFPSVSDSMGSNIIPVQNNSTTNIVPMQYNYNINVNAQTNANADDIANVVMYKIRSANAQQVRGGRIVG